MNLLDGRMKERPGLAAALEAFAKMLRQSAPLRKRKIRKDGTRNAAFNKRVARNRRRAVIAKASRRRNRAA